MNGKLIVLEGVDGSGKATQSKLLVDYFRSKNIPVETISFPRYTDSFFGKLVGRFLSGEFGKLQEISPYLASLPYAMDRRNARQEIVNWLKKGKMVVADRYVTSSFAHQAAKLPAEKRPEFIEWLRDMEYNEHKMPVPDIVLFLYIPWEKSQELASKRARGTDIADQDSAHQKSASEVYKWLALHESVWKQINCMDKAGRLRPIDEIHTELLQTLRTTLNIVEID